MSGLKDVTSTMSGDNGTHESEAESHFRRRSLSRRRWWNIPRRYALAIMCYLAFFLTGWMLINMFVIFSHLLFIDDEESINFPKHLNLTFEDIDKMDSSYAWGSVYSQIPGAILVIKYTGHRVLTVCVAAASVLHMITPLTMHHHILGTMAVVCLQGVATGPMIVACLSIWREWAPPAERTRLVALALGGIFISPNISIPLCSELIKHVSPVASFFIPGFCGLTWSIVWHSLTSDSPTNDPLISETELLYLEEKIPPENKLKIELKKIPIKSIFTSPPVLSLCFVFFAEGYVLQAMLYGSFMFYAAQVSKDHDTSCANIFYIIFNAIIPLTGYLADFLIIKSNGKVTVIRKCFYCAAAAIHSVFIFAVFTPDLTASVTCFILSYFAVTLSMPGYISNALDLSPYYVSVLVAITMMCSKISTITFDYVAEYMLNQEEGFKTWKMPLLVAGLLSASAAGVFSIFGSGDEQPWSSNSIPHSSSQRNRNDSLCYPAGADTEENSLVTDTV